MPYCPSQDEIHDTLMALLPRGRAWQTHDATIPRSNSVMQSFVYALAGQFKVVEDDLYQAFDELFASTAEVDLDLWLQDYGLPDDCDPFGDNLVGKVAAVGGTSIAYYEGVATSLGWSTEMRWLKGDDSEFPSVASTLHVVINGAASSSAWSVFRPGAAIIGEAQIGEPDTTQIICVLERITPAHVAITYEVIKCRAASSTRRITPTVPSLGPVV